METVHEKLNRVLKKSYGLSALIKISKILTDEDTSENSNDFPANLNRDDSVYLKYTPVTSVDVERSFSAYETLPQITMDRSNSKI